MTKHKLGVCVPYRNRELHLHEFIPKVGKYLKEQGFEFEISENYGEPLTEGTYKVKHDIYNLDGDIIINMDESVEFTETTDTIMGYDVFKYNNVYLTTEDLNG